MKERITEEPGDIIDFPIERMRPDPKCGNIHEAPTKDVPERKATERVKPAVYRPVPAETMLSEVRDAIQTRPEDDQFSKALPTQYQVHSIPELPSPRGKGSQLGNMMKRLDVAEKYGAVGSVGIVAKVSAKYVAYYADDLTVLLLEELLGDTVMELQRVEEVMELHVQGKINTEANEALDGLLTDFNSAVSHIQHKWTDRPKPIPHSQILDVRAPILIESRPLIWEFVMSDAELRRIHAYKRAYEEYLRATERGANLAEICARIGDQWLVEVLDSALGEFDECLGDFTAQVISTEMS
jgi:hypothetical protein